MSRMSLRHYRDILHVGGILVYVLRLIRERRSNVKRLFSLVVIFQVTNAQLEALRIENRHLRDTALNEQLTVSQSSGHVQDQSRFFYSVVPYTAGDRKILD